MNLQRIHGQIERMMRKFPSEMIEVFRPELDTYQQPTGQFSALGRAECWKTAMSQPSKWVIGDAGQQYDDAQMRWICLLDKPETPNVRHGDVVQFADGTKRIVRNIRRDSGIRIYWQLSEV